MHEDAGLIEKIRASFRNRQLPREIVKSPHKIDPCSEGAEVERFFSKTNFIVSRGNECLVAFNYFSTEGAIYFIPYFMISIIENYEHDDFMIDLLLGALATGSGNGLYQARDNIGTEMKSLSTESEAISVCSFVDWIRNKLPDPTIASTSTAALQVWRTHD